MSGRCKVTGIVGRKRDNGVVHKCSEPRGHSGEHCGIRGNRFTFWPAGWEERPTARKEVF
jgi:hypothetical protein